MAYLNPNDAHHDFRTSVLDALKENFPIEGRNRTLEIEDLEIPQELDPDDLRAQKKAKVEGKTWAEPVFATMALKDKETGEVVDRKKMRVAELPRMTRRYSYIVDGQEYQMNNQWQWKPGVYTRRKQNGELESRFNVVGRSKFDVTFDPSSKLFTMERKKANVPLYPVMKAMGVSDEDLKKRWGEEIFEANKAAPRSGDVLKRLFKSDKKRDPVDDNEAIQHLSRVMQESKLRPDATELTLGKKFEHVTGDALVRSTQKILRVQGGEEEDDREALIFKDLRSTGDFAAEKIKANARTLSQKIGRKINNAMNVRDVLKFDMLNSSIKDTFTKNSLSEVSKQINPVEMVSIAQQTTFTGPGGIQNEHQIMDEAKFINPSHLGYLDPINTPEGGKTGVTLRLPVGVTKKGHEPRMQLYNTKSGKTEWVAPNEFYKKKVVLPDQVDWDTKTGKPRPKSSTVKMSGVKNDLEEGSFKDADYVMKHPSQVFNMTSNLIPFLANTQGNRAGMASRHIEQAISLEDREAPLVQVGTGARSEKADTFEKLMGMVTSHISPIDGKVTAINKDGIVVKGKDGKEREVQIYDNFPLNDAKSLLHSVPTVKVGDTVKKDQAIADTNYSKGGQLALGKNLEVAYLPYKGYNFEDGVVISEAAAKKLSSMHMYRKELALDKEVDTSLKKFKRYHATSFKKDQLEKVDDEGIVRVGQRVGPGDPLVLATQKYELRDPSGLQQIRKSLRGQQLDKSIRWEADVPGEVVAVHRDKGKVSVHVKTVEPMRVGDKMSGRYGNKGIVTAILGEDEMPKTRSGKTIDVALNPTGVPGRMNIGQVLETAASKIAEKMGKPYVVENFKSTDDALAKVKADLKKYNLEDTEELIDPKTGKSLGKALTGKQHILKLVHQIDKKEAVRSGMGLPGIDNKEGYDINLQPTGSSGSGGQSIGSLGMYALLAHGAKANIREMQTWKSEGDDPQPVAHKRWPSQHSQVWNRIQRGEPLPVPKSTFAFSKFTDMLRAAGVNVEKKGNEFKLMPLTEDKIRELSGNRVLTKPSELVYAKPDKQGNPKPKAGGLFDEHLTGGHGGRKWSRIELAEPLPNPSFEAPIKALTGLKQSDYDALIGGEKAIDAKGSVVSVGTKGAVTGGKAIASLLSKIDVKKELTQAEKALKDAPSSSVDKALKKVKYLKALDTLGKSAEDAYVLKSLPVLPPTMRPISLMPDGKNINYADLNALYSSFAQVNDQLKDPDIKGLPDTLKKDQRAALYDGVKALMGLSPTYADADNKGVLHQISGSSPKYGYFQKTLLSRKQDLTMRSTIVPEPSLSLDEVGLPKDSALNLFRPFVVRKLVEQGSARSVLEAQKMLADKKPDSYKALEKVMEERPVLLKRDPALHKYSVQGFRPRLVPGKAIQIHPLVTGGYNADFDGDQMSVYVPIGKDAVQEAERMKPSNNLFAESSGKVMYQPSLESVLGLYKLSRVGQKTGKQFKDSASALKALHDQKIGPTDVVKIGKQETTTGRLLLAAAVPDGLKSRIVNDLKFTMDKKGIDQVFTAIAKDNKAEFSTYADKLKDLGNNAAYGLPGLEDSSAKGMAKILKEENGSGITFPVNTHTLSLDDFTPDKKTRELVLKKANTEISKIRSIKSLTRKERERREVEVWDKAGDMMVSIHKAKQEKKANPSNLFIMHKAGIKPGTPQYKQMVLAPMIMQDAKGRDVPLPVTKSYSEGVDLGGYWTSMHGARRGTVLKVQSVRDPGYWTKQVQSNVMDTLVTGDDCGTSKGVAMSVGDKDIHDRVLMKDFSAGQLKIPAGTVLNPDVVGKIRTAKKDAQIVVRSPLKCEHAKGICQKCMGLSSEGKEYDLGTNVGVMAGQALGERATQLTLKEFHTGGVKGGGAKTVNQFSRMNELTNLPAKIPNAARLAMTDGIVEKVEKDPTGAKIWINGKAHHVGKDPQGTPLYERLPGSKGWEPPRPGMRVRAGSPLSDPTRTVINPHDLYKATGSIDKVQNQLTNELHGMYSDQGIRRRDVEVVVKAMTNLTKVRDPGDAEGIYRGEMRSYRELNALNRELAKKGKKPVGHKPVLKGVMVAPLELREDWMAKMHHPTQLKRSVLEAAHVGAVSDIHSTHPTPAIAYGAEIGRSKKDSLKFPYSHLKDVPDHYY